MKNNPSILTNMAFWQSTVWCERTSSIYDMHQATGSKQDPHFLPAWREAWKLFRQRKNYDVIVTLGARTSLLYGMLCNLRCVPSKQIMTEVFIDAPQPHNPLWHVKNYLYRLVSRHSIGILTNSQAEIHTMAQRYGIPEKQLRFVPMHSNITEPKYTNPTGKTVVCAGRTLRDYATMIKAAEHISAPVTIICGMQDKIPPTPANVTILREIERERYLEILKQSILVALPLLNTQRSTGQVVLLEAMAFGKPVVTTDSPGTHDHIQHRVTGILVEEADDAALAREVNQLITDPSTAKTMGQNAAEAVKHTYHVEVHARKKLNAIQDLYDGGSALTRPTA